MKKSFTLVEILVAVSLFVIVGSITIIALQTFVSYNLANQKERESLSNLAFAFDLLSREARLGQNFKCEKALPLGIDGLCQEISFLSKKEISDTGIRKIEFGFDNSSDAVILRRRECDLPTGGGRCRTTWVPVSDPEDISIVFDPSDLSVPSFFFVNDGGSGDDQEQPFIEIGLNANYENIEGETRTANLKTRVTQRIFGGVGVTTENFSLSDATESVIRGWFKYRVCDGNGANCENRCFNEKLEEGSSPKLCNDERILVEDVVGVDGYAYILGNNGRIYRISTSSIGSLLTSSINPTISRVCGTRFCDLTENSRGEVSEDENEPKNIVSIGGSLTRSKAIARSISGEVYYISGRVSRKVKIGPEASSKDLKVDYIKFGGHVSTSGSGDVGYLIFRKESDGQVSICDMSRPRRDNPNRIFELNPLRCSDLDGLSHINSPKTVATSVSLNNNGTINASSSHLLYQPSGSNNSIRKCVLSNPSSCSDSTNDLSYTGIIENETLKQAEEIIGDSGNVVNFLAGNKIFKLESNSLTALSQTDADDNFIPAKKLLNTRYETVFQSTNNEIYSPTDCTSGSVYEVLNGGTCSTTAGFKKILEDKTICEVNIINSSETNSIDGENVKLALAEDSDNEYFLLINTNASDERLYIVTQANFESGDGVVSTDCSDGKINASGDDNIYRYNRFRIRETIVN